MALPVLSTHAVALVAALALLPAHAALAQRDAKPADPGPIRDNSFLVEEAYNQDPRVVQHISTFQRDDQSGAWLFTFTQEWPVTGMRHQLSYTLPFASAGEGAAAGVGDALVNYRYQLVGGEEQRVAIAPRLSLVLPTGSVAQQRGRGHAGIQTMLPMSVVLSPTLVAHSNLGVTATPHAESADGSRASPVEWNAGQSLVWLATPVMNLMLEGTWLRGGAVVAPGRVSYRSTTQLSPGIRFAINRASGMQIVPGAALPVVVGRGRPTTSMLLYFSVEHPF